MIRFTLVLELAYDEDISQHLKDLADEMSTLTCGHSLVMASAKRYAFEPASWKRTDTVVGEWKLEEVES